MITTALAFVLWFGAVQTLGSAKAGLLVGFMPIAAVTVDAALNGRTPSAADLAGTALVAAGDHLRGDAGASAQPVVGSTTRSSNVGQRSDDARPPRTALFW